MRNAGSKRSRCLASGCKGQQAATHFEQGFAIGADVKKTRVRKYVSFRVFPSEPAPYQFCSNQDLGVVRISLETV